MDARAGLVALLLGAVLLSGCTADASDTATNDEGGAVASGDPAYAMAQLRNNPDEEGVVPIDLEEALPNHRVRWRGPMFRRDAPPVTFSDALVVGTVTHVVKGQGVIWRGEDDFTVVGYDADADTRTVYVTMSVDHVVGPIDADARAVTFRVLVPSAANPQEFVEGMAGLGRVAVLLDDDPNRAEAVPWRPILNDSLIGVVSDDGSLSLPALTRVLGPSFAGDIHTADQLLTAAREPVTRTTHHSP